LFTSSHLSQHFASYLISLSMNNDRPEKSEILNYKKLLEKIAGTEFEEKKFELLEKRAKKIPTDFPFLPELMKDFKRAGLTGNPNLLRQDGFERGWDEFQYISEEVSLDKISKHGFWKSSSPKINEQVLKFLDENKSENIFVWAHYN